MSLNETLLQIKRRVHTVATNIHLFEVFKNMHTDILAVTLNAYA